MYELVEKQDFHHGSGGQGTEVCKDVRNSADEPHTYLHAAHRVGATAMPGSRPND
jgi:hypothetical protein